MVCGNASPRVPVSHFKYRSSSYLTEFFEDCDLEFAHDGSTRWAWVSARLEEVLAMPHPGPSVPPEAFVRIIRALIDKGDAHVDDPDRVALSKSNRFSLIPRGKTRRRSVANLPP